MHTIIDTNCFEERDAHVIVVHQTVEDDSTRKKNTKTHHPKKTNLYNDNKISSRKIEKRFVHEALHVVETPYLLGLLVVMWHYACIQPALATITHVHETGFNKFMFNSQEWIVIGGCCGSSI